jgi:hypothetical protein
MPLVIMLVLHNFGIGWPMPYLMLSGSLGVILIGFGGMVTMLKGGTLYHVMMKDKLEISTKGYLVY